MQALPPGWRSHVRAVAHPEVEALNPAWCSRKISLHAPMSNIAFKTVCVGKCVWVSRDLHVRDRSRNLRFDAAPADGFALHGAHHRAEQDDIHHLAIVKALQQQGPEQ